MGLWKEILPWSFILRSFVMKSVPVDLFFVLCLMDWSRAQDVWVRFGPKGKIWLRQREVRQLQGAELAHRMCHGPNLKIGSRYGVREFHGGRDQASLPI